jgi:RNA polymerase sigma-70 factor (ECF subfamily)
MRTSSGFFTAVDEIQVAKARRGDLEALEGLYRIFSAPVANLARRLCHSLPEAEEVVQETFLEMVRSMASYRGDGAFGAWLRRIAVSKALTVLRSRRKLPNVVEHLVAHTDGAAEPAAAIDGGRGWHRVDLERALALLPAEARAVVWLHDVEGLTHDEIAALFGRSTSFSKSRLSRAHARLRELLGSWTKGMTDASEPGRAAGAARR